MSEPSGRELDVALAKALGWKVQGCDCGNADCGKQYVAATPDAPEWLHGEEVPFFSGVGAGWQLVAERMRQKGYTVLLYWWAEWEPGDIAGKCQCTTFDAKGREITAVADTPGAAVALAAYRALRSVQE